MIWKKNDLKGILNNIDEANTGEGKTLDGGKVSVRCTVNGEAG